MKKFLGRLVWLPLGVVVVTFLVANRQPVAVSLDPISTSDPAFATPALPLWFWLMLALLIGVFSGAAGMWLSSRGGRMKARAEHRELKALQREVERLRAAPADGEPPTLKAS